MGSLRPQHDLHEGASDRREKLPPLDQMFRRMFNEEIVPPMDDIVDATAQSITRKMHGAVLTNRRPASAAGSSTPTNSPSKRRAAGDTCRQLPGTTIQRKDTTQHGL
jgi:hypothetical protein